MIKIDPKKSLCFISSLLVIFIACGREDAASPLSQFGPNPSGASAPIIELEEAEKLAENVFSQAAEVKRGNHWGYKMFLRIHNKAGAVIGTVRSPWFSIRKTVKVYDRDEVLRFEARKDLLSWGSRVQIFGPDKKAMQYVVREKVIQSPIRITNQLEIKDSDLKLIGRSKKFNLIGTTIEILSAQDNEEQLFKFKRNPFSGVAEMFGYDSWKVDHGEKGPVPIIVPIVIASYKTLAAIDERSVAQESEALEDSQKTKKE